MLESGDPATRQSGARRKVPTRSAPNLPNRQAAGLPRLIPHSRPWITPADIRAVAGVLGTGALAQGRQVQGFEAEVGAFLDMPPGVAVSSGTAALHLALIGLGIGPGDEVVLPSYVCVAPLHAIEYVGATPRVADIDPATYNLDPVDTRRRLTRRTRAIIVPHLFGLPADLDELLRLGVPIIEDCAQAIGAQYRDRLVGSFGTVGILSFYATKLFTTGEGGMVVSRNRRLLAGIRDLRDYDERRRHAVRFNYKLTEFQAALGRSQLRRLPTMLTKRVALANRYQRHWSALPIRIPAPDSRRTHIYHRFVISCPSAATRVAKRLFSSGVTARPPIFRPIHMSLGLDGFPGADHASRHALSLPLYPALTMQEAGIVMRAIPDAIA
jgi:perosamine synthetase